MRRVFLSLLLLCGIAFSKTIHVPDDKPTIQTGIDSAAVGDTVLVQPNTYLESIDFKGKNIVVGSLFLTTGDTSYISQTVIMGDETCWDMVDFYNGEDSTAVLNGFTITKSNSYGGYKIYCSGSGPRLENLIIKGGTGSGLYCEHANLKLINSTILNNSDLSGGGIYCINSELTLSNVSIVNNTAFEVEVVGNGFGGGIYCESSTLVMSDVLLTGNHADGSGGGIYLNNSELEMENVTISHNYAESGGGMTCSDSDVNFSFENRCNIYWNYATSGSGNEISIGGNMLSVVVDTFTVFNPTDEHIYPLNQCTYNILHAKVIPVPADLYVSSLGDDSNSGLSPSEPLRSIRMALAKVIVDSLHPRTIFLGEGQYSASTTGEVFPINMKSHLTLRGDSSGQVMIDANGSGSVFCLNNVRQEKFQRLTITGGSADQGGGIYCKGSVLYLENVRLWQNNAYADIIEGPIPHEIYGEGGGIYCTESELYIRDSSIEDNSSFGGEGGGIYIHEDCRTILDHVLIRGNQGNEVGGIYLNGHSVLKNVTIADNTNWVSWGQNLGIGITCIGGELLIVNSVVWGNKSDWTYPYEEISLYNTDATIAYSDVRGGSDSIEVGGQTIIYWREGNVDADPLFLNPDSGDFRLQEGSPCIDAGTPFFVWEGDTILNLSSVDYSDDAPDMGAYESNFTSVSKFQKQLPARYSLSQNYPNPFNPETFIQYDLPKENHVKIDIYNLLGQNVISLVDEQKVAGSYFVKWKGLDRFGNKLPSGTYFLRMNCGEFSQVRKIVLMK